MVQGVSFDGMASGLDTDNIIQQMMEIERISVRRLEAQKEETQTEQQVWQQINQSLHAFDSSLDALKDSDTFESREVNSTRDDIVTATAEEGANEASYQLHVEQLATVHQVSGKQATELEGIDAGIYSFELNEQPNAGDTIEIGGETFEFGAGGVEIGEDLEETTANLRDAMEDSTIAHRFDISATDNQIELTENFLAEPSGDLDIIEFSFDGEDSYSFELAQQAETGDTIQIAGVEFSFGDGEDEIEIGDDLDETVANLREAINVHEELGDRFDAGGVGNTITLTETTTSDLNEIKGDNVSELTDEELTTTDQLGLQGSFEINGTEIKVDSVDSMRDIRDAINDSEANVQASLLDGRLILNSSETGTENDIELTDGDNILDSLGILQNGDFFNERESQDAIFEVDGHQITRSTNTGIDDAVEGLKLDLHDVNQEGESFNLTVNNNKGLTKDAISNFVQEYNKVQGHLEEISKEGGALQGDLTVRRLANNIRRQVTSTINIGNDDYNQLAQLGIEIDPDAEPGDRDPANMQIDEAKLDAVLSENPEVVQQMFTDRENGLADRTSNRIEQYIRSGNGVIPNRDSALNSRMGRIDRRIENQERRLERRERSMRRKFTRMETAMNEMNAQQSWLNGQIQSLEGNRR